MGILYTPQCSHDAYLRIELFHHVDHPGVVQFKINCVVVQKALPQITQIDGKYLSR
jgi:hypothetical protein